MGKTSKYPHNHFHIHLKIPNSGLAYNLPSCPWWTEAPQAYGPEWKQTAQERAWSLRRKGTLVPKQPSALHKKSREESCQATGLDYMVCLKKPTLSACSGGQGVCTAPVLSVNLLGFIPGRPHPLGSGTVTVADPWEPTGKGRGARVCFHKPGLRLSYPAPAWFCSLTQITCGLKIMVPV